MMNCYKCLRLFSFIVKVLKDKIACGEDYGNNGKNMFDNDTYSVEYPYY